MFASPFLLSVFVVGAYGHGAVTFPRPRNAIDAETKYGAVCSNPSAQHLKGNGQACFWFSHGCSIGCNKCDGTQGSPGHDDATYPKFLYKGMNKEETRRKNITVPPFIPKLGDMVLDPNAIPKPVIKSPCGRPGKPTICDSHLRTMNTQAKCGSPEDIYQLSPWRAPGSAPVIDACGAAGGRLPGMGEYPGIHGAVQAVFYNTTLAKENDVGSRLPPMSPQAIWKAGSNVEVGWTLKYQHGGGYSYRLAPADAPLTEETFSKMPLDFVGPSFLRWDGDKSTQLKFNATRVSTGTLPIGSMWQKNPVPRGAWQWDAEGPAFEPACEETEARQCSGNPSNLEIVDVLKIPALLKPGRYVLGWRWDAEETNQVWSSCSDVMVTGTTDAFV